MDYIYKEGERELLIESKKREVSEGIINKLIEIRKQKEMTQQQVADATGIKRANIARIEGKKNTPTLDVLIKYAECLGMELEISLKDK